MKTFSLIAGVALMLALELAEGADERLSDDAAKLQGTWKLIQADYNGKLAQVSYEMSWTISGDKLYEHGKVRDVVISNIYEIKLDPESNPKSLDLGLRMKNLGTLSTDKACYRFVGGNLEIAQMNINYKRPASFQISEDEQTGERTSIKVFKRVSDQHEIPKEMLEQFQDDPALHSRHRAAEIALLSLMKHLLRDAPLKEIEPLIADGKAEELLEVMGSRAQSPQPSPEERETALKRLCVRDPGAGEHFFYHDGTELVVGANTSTSDKVLLVLLEGRRETGFFWVLKDRGQWRVDVTNMIERARQPGRAILGGVRFGMTLPEVRKLVFEYSKVAKVKSLRFAREVENQLVFKWDDGKGMAEHAFNFVDGKLREYVRTDSKGRKWSIAQEPSATKEKAEKQ